MMRYGKTTASVHLRKEPRPKAPILDSLEPDYPLRVVNYDPAEKWVRVIVPPQGNRDEAQDGWIDARFVAVEPEPKLTPKIDWPLVIGPLLIIGFLALLVYSLS